MTEDSKALEVRRSSLGSTSSNPIPIPSPLTPLLQDTSLLDAQPYIDDDNLLQQLAPDIDAMILNESSKIPGGVNEYMEMVTALFKISGEDPNTALQSNDFIRTELERVQRGEKLNAADSTRYDIKGQDGKKGQEGNGEVAYEKVAVAEEVQRRAVEQLELIQRFGPASWKGANGILEATLRNARKLKEHIGNSLQRVNEERKMQHRQTGDALRNLNSKYKSLVQENAKIDSVCLDLLGRTNASSKASEENSK